MSTGDRGGAGGGTNSQDESISWMNVSGVKRFDIPIFCTASSRSTRNKVYHEGHIQPAIPKVRYT